MSVGEIYVLKMKQESDNVAILNQFFYKEIQAPTLGSAEELAKTFDSIILAEWAGSVVDAISCILVEVFAIETPTDFFELSPTNEVGLRVSTPATLMPTYMAFSYASNRDGAGTRRSFKRFAGLLDVDVDGNSLSSSFLSIDAVGDLRALLGSNLIGATGGVFQPYQIKAGWKAGFVPVEHFALPDWQIPKLSSQVSRKP